MSFIFAIVIGAIAGTILLSICSLLCVKGCYRSRKFGTRFVTEVENQSVSTTFPCRSRASIHTSTNESYGKVFETTTRPRLILTSTNKAYGKLRARGETHSPTSTNVARGKVLETPTRPRLIPTSANKAYVKLRVRGGHSPTSTNQTSREGEEVGYELVDVHRRESPPPPQGSELEGMYEVPLAPGSPSHPLPTNLYPNAGDKEDTVYEVIR